MGEMFKYGINSCLFTRASHLHEGVYGKGVPEVMHLRTMMVAEARDSADVTLTVVLNGIWGR